MTDLELVEEQFSMFYTAKANDMQGLVCAIMEEALCGFQSEPFFVGRRVIVEKLDLETWSAEFQVFGECFDLEKHTQLTDVKAITYSNMQIHQKDDRCDIYKKVLKRKLDKMKASQGRDILASAKTGSGKTLAFLIPAIELLLKLDWKQYNGTGVIIISPTRELSMQTYGVLTELLEGTNLSHGLVMGGSNRSAEQEKLAKILRYLPKKRQTMLFSATHTPKVDELVKLSLHSNPVKLSVAEKSEAATVEGLQQGYVVCPSEKRFLMLFTFLKKNKNKKVMVFFSSCNSVKYHHELLNYIDIPCMSIHGKQKQAKRTSTFFQFCQAETGILLCTDVAASTTHQMNHESIFTEWDEQHEGRMGGVMPCWCFDRKN
ncbi:DEAD/DEAH box helicase [Cooperia oncophora]